MGSENGRKTSGTVSLYRILCPCVIQGKHFKDSILSHVLDTLEASLCFLVTLSSQRGRIILSFNTESVKHSLPSPLGDMEDPCCKTNMKFILIFISHNLGGDNIWYFQQMGEIHIFSQKCLYQPPSLPLPHARDFFQPVFYAEVKIQLFV